MGEIEIKIDVKSVKYATFLLIEIPNTVPPPHPLSAYGG
jgi:hypothetical protein